MSDEKRPLLFLQSPRHRPALCQIKLAGVQGKNALVILEANGEETWLSGDAEALAGKLSDIARRLEATVRGGGV